MGYPFLRSDEKRPETPGPTPGVCVILSDMLPDLRGRFFFAGGSEQEAMILARLALPQEALDHPLTRIEFGVAHDKNWVCEQVIKAPPSEQTLV